MCLSVPVFRRTSALRNGERARRILRHVGCQCPSRHCFTPSTAVPTQQDWRWEQPCGDSIEKRSKQKNPKPVTERASMFPTQKKQYASAKTDSSQEMQYGRHRYVQWQTRNAVESSAIQFQRNQIEVR
jgi:hypothetical protein